MFVVGDLLRWNRRRYPSDLALVDETGSMTWSHLVDRSWALARGLLECGLRAGDNVGVLSGNSRFAAETYLGAAAAGVCSVLYNWRWATPELVHGIISTEARVILVEREYADALDAARETGQLEHVEHIIVQGPRYEAFLRPGGAPSVQVAPNDPNTIIFTGGTTGFSKGVVLTHRNVLANCVNEIVDTDMDHRDRTLIIAPMFHSGSLLCWFLPHVMVGAVNVLLRSFDEEQVARTIQEHGTTNGFLVPNMVRRLLISGELARYDVSSYQRLYVGGATFKMPDKEAAQAALPTARVYYQYGLTEAGPIVSRLRPEDMFRSELDGSIGQEFVLSEVTIRDTENNEVEAGSVGEICVRGPGVMLGYYKQEEATQAALHGGWLHTGDLAARDQDGYLFYHDRLKDMIKTGGENVYSAEVEQVLYGHPLVAEAAVIGVPSTEWDEEVRAVVAVRPGADTTEQELRAHCRAALAGYKVPKRIAFIELGDMPVNPTGKILKTELRRRPLWDDVLARSAQR
jgi:fatty-acyl-CoA synthase